MKLNQYIDSTYLKTPAQSGYTEEQTRSEVYKLADEAIADDHFAVMIRPEFVKEIKNYLDENNSSVKVGTVISFPEGDNTTEEKLAEAQQAITDGADDLDFVANYKAYKKGDTALVRDEVLVCTRLGLEHSKTVKWIIEIAALTDHQIAGITGLIREVSELNFTPEQQKDIFVKSSTGFYKTKAGRPNGATTAGIKIMKANAGNLSIKAAGGVRTPQEAEDMISLGVTRIGTSSAAALLGKGKSVSGY